MIFIVSDLHLGKDVSSDADSLTQLSACLESTRPDHLIFLGDVFDAFIDTGNEPPSYVEAWASGIRPFISNGCQVSYLMGNHDRWHRGYVEQLTGNAPIRRSMSLDWAGQHIQLEHGDFGPSHDGSTSFARWLSDLPLMHRLYTSVLPFGGAGALAAAISRRFSSFEPNPAAVKALRDYAGQVVATQGVDGVIMGHCHQPGLFDLSMFKQDAWYLNSGDWYEHRSFLLLDDDRQAQLCGWHDDALVVFDSLSV